MSTVDHSATVDTPVHVPVCVPHLQNGDHLTREEYERRYNAMPGLKGAELIEGVVFMPSPTRFDQHGKPHGVTIAWLAYYTSKTPGIDFSGETSTRLDKNNMPEPDAMLLLPAHLGATAHIDDDGYVSGAPDLVAEIAASSVSIDLHTKLEVYRRSGVREYLVIRTEDRAIDCFELVDGQYQPKTPDKRGRLRSKLFPGLWLDPAALLAGDLAKLFATVDEGTSSDEHRAFVEKLAAGKK